MGTESGIVDRGVADGPRTVTLPARPEGLRISADDTAVVVALLDLYDLDDEHDDGSNRQKGEQRHDE